MNEHTHHDRLRAWITGALSRDEREALERELESDAELRQRALALRDVWRATSGLGELAPVSATSWDHLRSREELDTRRRRTWRVAAAVFLLVPLGVLAWRAWPVRAKAPVVVRSTLLEEPARAPQAALPVPEVLASYAPVRDGAIQWLSSMEDARQLSDAVGRPLLVFGFVPGCPWCKQLREESFVDPKFLALAAGTVPVEVDLLSFGQERAIELMQSGYPAIELQARDGNVVHAMSGPPGTFDLPLELERGLQSWPPEPAPLVWSTANELARELELATSAERDGRLGDAWRAFDDLARRGGATALGLDGQLGMERVEADARKTLTDVRAARPEEAREARAELARLAARLEGTPPGDDLRRVLDAWDDDRAFPVLAPQRSE